MGQGVSRVTNMETHSRQKESTPYLQYTGNPVPKVALPKSAENEIEMLMSQVDTMMAQLQAIYTRISVIQSGREGDPIGITDGNLLRKTSKATDVGRVAAVVDQDECINCGICASVCPAGAIIVGEATVVDPYKCTGCGACVDECPNEAIGLTILKETP